MSTTESRMNIRIEKEIKEEAMLILEELGLDASTAIRIYFKQIIAQNGLPFTVTRESIREREIAELKYELYQSKKEHQEGQSENLEDFQKNLIERYKMELNE